MDEKQATFIKALEQFILQVNGMKQFRGKAQVLKSLRRISTLAVFQ